MLRVGCLLLSLSAVCGDAAPPTATLDLDAPPSTRWDAIVTQYNASLWASVTLVEQTSPTYKYLLSAANALFHNESHSGWLPREHWEEIASIVRLTKLPVGVLVALNGLYDVTASKQSSHHACTSIVAQGLDGSIVAGRNLDYNIHEAMKNITIVVDWQREGTTIFTSVMYVGTIGFNTVQRTGAWSLTHDERDQGSIGLNWFDVFVRHRVLTFSRIRLIAQEATTYDAAVQAVKGAALSAASYFVLAGVRSGEGVLLTRGRDVGDVDVLKLQPSAGRWYLLETNYDHWKPPPDSPTSGDDRRDPGEAALARMGQKNVSADGLLTVLSDQTCNRSRGERNILNAHTVYTAVMLPAQRGLRVVLRTTPRAECGSSDGNSPSLVEAN